MTVSEDIPGGGLTSRRIWSWVFGLLAAGGALVIAATFLGALHPAFDSLAVFRGVFAAATGICALTLALLGRVRGAALAAILPLVALLSLAPHWFGNRAAPDGLVLYQKNLWYKNPVTRDVIADIRAVAPDVVTLQEVARRNETLLEDLSDAYPTQFRCPFYRVVGDVAILSRWPMVPGSELCEERRGLGAITVETPQGLVTVVAVHFHWPWPHAQPFQAEDLEPALRALAARDAPMIIGGDFNMVRWSWTLGRLAEVSGTEPLGASLPTYTRKPWMPVGLAIDSVFATGGTGNTGLRPLFRSDHKGVVAQVALP